MSERSWFVEGPGFARLHKPEQELCFAFHALVKESVFCRCGRSGEFTKSFRAQPELATSGGEDTVRVRDRSRLGIWYAPRRADPNERR